MTGKDTKPIENVPLLPLLNQPRGWSMLAGLKPAELRQLAEEIRTEMIRVVSRTGGHLAPNLGVVELTLALLRVFDPLDDRIIWDVGHQAYAYKMLTGRLDNFGTLRQMGGVSGFPKRSENSADHFGVGHASTSISAALGMAMARDLAQSSRKVVAVIGDGSMTAGLAYEGLNQAGGMHRDLVVVLNDNEMSISKSVGALSAFLSRQLSSRWVRRMKRDVEALVKYIPKGDDIYTYLRRGEHGLKSFLTPGMLFEAFQFNYLGPIDGHDVGDLTEIFRHARDLDGPQLVHVLTKKGKGYEPAEKNPTYYHGVSCFEPETGKARKFTEGECPKSYTDVFGDTLCELAERDSRIVAITAAMPEGTGLTGFAQRFPDRFVDVGICEQHAVTFAAGLATEGFHPVVAVYSTFLQRSYDQIIHDVALQNLPVTFCLDRGGLVGEDGPTHHGAFDLSFLRHIPGLVVMAPKDEAELRRMLVTAMALGGPSAIRYPRGVGVGAELDEQPEPLPLGEGELLREGGDALVVAIGSRVHPCLEMLDELAASGGPDAALFNARFVKPLPEAQLRELTGKHKRWLIAEENVLAGGFGSAVLEFLSDEGLLSGLTIRRKGLPDAFVEHGTQKELRRKLGIDREGIKAALLELAR